MKTLYAIILVLISFSSYSQTYRIYTAKANGNWGTAGTWNSVARTDGVNRNKYIIPAAYTVVATSNLDYTLYGDVDVTVSGTLRLAANTLFGLTAASTIEVLTGGSIEASGITVISIGSSWKFLSFGNRTLDGPVYSDFITTGFAAAILSVKFLNFTAATENANNITLRWATSNEINNNHFDIEFSTNGSDWTKIGKVNSVERNSPVNNYTYTHRNVAGSMVSYRLKQVDKDGRFEYSEVAVVRLHQGGANIFTANKKVYVELNGDSRNTMIKVLDMNGQVLLSRFNQGSSKIEVDASKLAKGSYVVQVSNSQMQAAKTIAIF